MTVAYRALIRSRPLMCQPRQGHTCQRSLVTLAVALISLLWLGASPIHAAMGTPPADAPAVSAPAATTSDPMATVKSGIGQAIAVFENHQMPLAQRRRTLRALAERYFDFGMMSRSVLGYHWRTLTDQQRAEFVPIFTGFIEDAYLSKLQDYTVHKVQQELQTARIAYVRQNFDGSDYAQVFTTVTLNDQPNPIEVDYYLIRTQGAWKVYDLSIESISVIANFRNQFNRVINNAGYDTLLDDLRAKQQRLQQDLDHPQSDSS
jgi:phospholipid transport system substrate-binding protein